MITIRPGSHVHTLLSILPFVGEYPMSALSLLGSVRSYKDLIHKLTQVQEFRFPDSDERFTCRLLNVCGRGDRKTVRFHKSALPMLQWWDKDAYENYMAEYDNHTFSGNARHVSRNHLLAETAVMCLKAGIEVDPLHTPDMWEERVSRLQDPNPYFYFAREVKRVYEQELNKVRYTRLAGMITFWNGVYSVYNLRNELPKWIADGERKIQWHMEAMFPALREEYHPFKRSALMFGANYDVALSLLQEIEKTWRLDNGFVSLYYQMLFVPINAFGVRLLRLVTSYDWQRDLLDSLFEPEQYIASWGTLQFDIYDNGIHTLCFLDGDIRKLFRFRNTILMRKEGTLESGLVKGHKIICYPEQLPFVQQYLGDLVEYSTVTMDDIEGALELNRPSLIE